MSASGLRRAVRQYQTLGESPRYNAAQMARLNGIFDRSERERRPPYRALLSEARSLLFYHPAPPDPATMPSGNGHVVLIIPAFLTTDIVTRPIRAFLERCGYRVLGWDLGINWGPTPRILLGLRRRVAELRDIEGGPISVIGVSLGGLLARDVAYDCPDGIRDVITLVSPIVLPTASTIEPLIRLCAPFYSSAIDLERLHRPLPMPATAVFTRGDGLVAWQSCASDDPNCISVEVTGSHVTICRNPEVLRLVAGRLART
jgi:pimeloyl-ACP methyl ester carboxylesterase